MTNVGSTMDLAFNKHITQLTKNLKIMYYQLQHPARSLFRTVQVFDSRFLLLTRDIYSYQIIRELANPSTFLIQEWSIYVNINLNLIEFSELNEFWDKVSLQLPLLEKIT